MRQDLTRIKTTESTYAHEGAHGLCNAASRLKSAFSLEAMGWRLLLDRKNHGGRYLLPERRPDPGLGGGEFKRVSGRRACFGGATRLLLCLKPSVPLVIVIF